MFETAKESFQEVMTGGSASADARIQKEWGLVRDFIRNNPGSNTRTICQKAGVRNKRANAILKARVENGELVAMKGPGGSTLYAVAGTTMPVSHETENLPISEAFPTIGKQDSLEASQPSPEPKILVPEAFPMSPEPISTNGKRVLPLPPDLGLALLSPGSDARVSRVSQSVSQSPESAPNPEPSPWLVELQ